MGESKLFLCTKPLFNQSSMLSVPPTVVARMSSLPLSAGERERSGSCSPEHQAPAVSVTRPSRVSASVDDSALDLLRARYNTQHRDRASSLSGHQFARTSILAGNQASRSAQTSPRLERNDSSRMKKLRLFKTPSNGANGYEALNGEVSDEIIFSREKITSVIRVLSRNSSFTSTPSSPRPYRVMSLVPAKHRIVQNDSCSDDESIRDVSPESESDLDFGASSRDEVNHVSATSLVLF